MPFPELKVGPQNLDTAGALAADLGTHNRANIIIQQVAKMYPRELVSAAVLPPDYARSDALDAEEVEDLARDEGLLSKDDEVVEGSLRVRGRNDREHVVHFLIRTPSGRTGRAMLPYSELPGSGRAYERALEEKNQGDGGGTQVVADADAAKAVRAAQERADAAEARLAEVEDKLDAAEGAAGDPPPFPGYEEINGDEIVERVRSGGREEFGVAGLQRVLEYEARHQDRKGVKTAVEKALGG